MGPGVAGLEKGLQELADEESSLGWGCAALEAGAFLGWGFMWLADLGDGLGKPTQ